MKTGSRLLSSVCDTEVMVVKGADIEIDCGGAPMVDVRTADVGDVATGFDGGTALGKRYVHEASGLQVLCVKPGVGSLSVDGEILPELAAKKLPSSD
ncbi:hypothetical protein [Gordonia terrae]|uniref:Uncharacterized protein n=2 Tax=Gordonia terrae TaxID=2055 RepID=A0AAD0NWF6_9ACTN|nr:hypothetical protein [Gordonia terrae]VTR09185.1 Uncharacterised protein [Clostridioides difficile]ANY21863.1 hypothetical protein BCM27_02715 [Gordonia terrae]AWO82598.1 hypothetical protein DLJ61_02730 [Gordonia terrae]VTS22536.1 Uncharacterised protein [Gordonia terrae]GAB46441.1 hypothetical protein GOTRE_159_00050 [Gordonia terrae NBRC 100016]